MIIISGSSLYQEQNSPHLTLRKGQGASKGYIDQAVKDIGSPECESLLFQLYLVFFRRTDSIKLLQAQQLDQPGTSGM